jgi:proline racemase
MVQFSHIISAIDAHTAGEPARIVLNGLPPIVGDTMAEKKHMSRCPRGSYISRARK